MQILLDKSNINYNKLKRAIHKIAATELSGLASPCYYPSLKKYYFELLYICKLKEKDVKDYVKRLYKGMPEAKWKLHADPISNFYIFLMIIHLQRRQVTTYKSMLIIYLIRNYTNLIHKQIQYCNEDVFKYALENISKTHLFSREKSIPNAIYFISKEMDKRYVRGFKGYDVKAISAFITESRTRISQSIKSFAEVYYKAGEEGKGIGQPYEGDDDNKPLKQTEKTSRLIEDVVKSITVYKNIDKKAMENARKLTKIKTNIAFDLSKALRDIKYNKDIRLILELFIKELETVGFLCGNEFYLHVRKLMSIKRTKSLIYFKQQINYLLLKLLKDIKYNKEYDKLTNQTKSLINLYLAYYITLCMRNFIC